MRPLIALPLLLALLPAAADAQRSPAKRTPRDAAASFTLDPQALASEAKPENEAVSSPDPATPAATPPAVASGPANAVAASSSAADTAVPASPAPGGAVTLFTLDTPIGTLIGDPGAKGVLDRDLPGLSGDENLDKFRGLSLRQFQPLTGGQLTVSLMAKVAGDLAVLAGEPNVAPPVPVAGRKTRRDDTGR